MKNTLLFAIVLSLVAAVPVVPAAAQDQPAVVVDYGVRAKMRDGVSLVADVYRPAKPGKYPVLLERTPYNRKGEGWFAMLLAAKDYVVILQDTRGRFESEGEFYPFRHEAADGYDTVEWAAGLEHSNGKVGMFGGSYVGATQMLAATEAPPHLVSIFPYVTASEYYEGWTYQSGALMQWFASSWSSGLAVDTIRRKTEARGNENVKKWVETMPVEDFQMVSPPPTAELAPYYLDWVKHERSDDYWKQWKVSDRYPKMTVKGLHGGGWHDLFLNGSINNYTGLRDKAATKEARDGQRLIVGPWAHAATSPEGKIGDVTFGKDAVFDSIKATIDWFDYTLKGVENGFASGKPVRLFVMGENAWRDEDEWPLKRTRYTKYYLHSKNGANSLSGDGMLGTEAPAKERADTYDYDPKNPVPTIGGRLCCGPALWPGPFDQRPNESRQDVLVFSTPALTEDVEATGYVTVELYASSSAVDTDFTALLVDVDPNGYARFLTDGIVRARYRNSTEKAEEIVPGKVYKYTIDMWATSNLFKAGHKIRVYVSSSNFPRFNRNLNTGEATFGSTRMLTAKQTIYHDSEYPSSLVLPIVPRSK